MQTFAHTECNYLQISNYNRVKNGLKKKKNILVASI